LREMGIFLTATQTAHMKTAKEAEKHAIILDAVESKYKGFAETVADTSQGALTQFSNVMGDIKEDTGKLLELPFKQVLQVATKGLQTLQTELNKVGPTGLNAKRSIQELLVMFYDMADGALSA